MRTSAKPLSALGFLTVVEYSEWGLIGGYLVLNSAGRPLEFHCTAPIKPNRAQRILYGPTLEPFLFGELIGKTLLAKAKVEPLVVCTDCEAVLEVRQYTSVPVALVLPSEESSDSASGEAMDDSASGEVCQRTWRPDSAHCGSTSLVTFHVGQNRLAVPESGQEERRRIGDRLVELSDSFDLAEPFQRICQAIEEACQGG